jgi:hypothetical protein
MQHPLKWYRALFSYKTLQDPRCPVLFQKHLCFNERAAGTSSKNSYSRFVIGVTATSLFTLITQQDQPKNPDEVMITKKEILRPKSNDTGIGLSDLQKKKTQELTMLEIETYSKEGIATHASLLEEWMRRDYIHYPYLWMPTSTEINLDVFLNEKTTLLTLIKREGRVVGMAAGMAFESEYLSNYFEAPLVKLTEEQGIRPETLYYISFFLTAPEYRNDKAIVESIYNSQAEHAHSLFRTHICFWSALDNSQHPLKPNMLTPVEPWGYVIGNYKPMHIELKLPWNTLQVDGSAKQEIHLIQFFTKSL